MFTRSRYKEDSPLVTVERVKKILDCLGVKTEVMWFNNGYGDFSCRLRIVNDRLRCFDIGTNGKGMSREYALASAYGEFMERIQNKAMFREGLKYATSYYLDDMHGSFSNNIRDNGLALDFLYYPDEFLKDDGVIYSPFLNLMTHRTEEFPIGYYRSVCGSTGMSAGNTIEEAICQALNEIVERYILCKIFSSGIRPRVLPVGHFAGTLIYQKIESLEKDYKIVIHDWSQDKGFPVIGMLLQRKEGGAYTYRVGADFNIITALERCFTETFQGSEVLNKLLKSPSSDYECSYQDYMRCRHNGTGVFPPYLLFDFEDEKELSYPHQDFLSYKEEVSFYLDWLKLNGYTAYIHDNSFLGFPAVTIYIPGMSDAHVSMEAKAEVLLRKLQERKHIEARYNLGKVIVEKKDLPLSWNPIFSDCIRLNPWNVNKGVVVYTHFAEALIQLNLNRYGAALEHIQLLVGQLKDALGEERIPRAYLVLRDVLVYLCGHQGLNVDSMDLESLMNEYGEGLVKSVVSMVKSVGVFVSSQHYPTCFDCAKCQIEGDCHFFEVVKLEKKLQDLQSQYYGTAISIMG